MKLYTEQQMSVAINAAKANPKQAYLIQAMLTPIELPTDEEIENESMSHIEEYGFEKGAKWLRDKILNK